MTNENESKEFNPPESIQTLVQFFAVCTAIRKKWIRGVLDIF